MEFSITIQDKNKITFKEVPTSHATQHVNSTTSFSAATTFGNISSQKTEGNGFTIWASDYFFKEEVVLNAVSAKPVLFFHLIFKDSVRIAFEEEEYVLSDGQFNLSSFPQFEILVNAGKRKHLRTFHIHFEPGILHGFLNGSKELEKFLKEAHRGNRCRLSDEQHFATAEMMAIINSIMDNPYEGKTRRLFIASQVNVLLLQSMLKIREDNKKQGFIPLSTTDREKISRARDYLANHLAERVSIQNLARIAGINDYQLKKGFKQLFGNTISKYHDNLRLQEAMRLLLETELPISEIGYSLGFEHPTYFSAAFRKKFGLPPGHFRK